MRSNKIDIANQKMMCAFIEFSHFASQAIYFYHWLRELNKYLAEVDSIVAGELLVQLDGSACDVLDAPNDAAARTITNPSAALCCGGNNAALFKSPAHTTIHCILL